MREVSINDVRQWTKVQGVATPKSFAEWCPHCMERVTFSTANHHHDPYRSCVVSSSRCPGCEASVGVWAIGSRGTQTSEIYIHPSTGAPHKPKQVAGRLDAALYRSYVSTVDAYNSGNYVATAVCCRRTLEGLFKSLLEEEERNLNLAKAIQRVADSVNLSEPISRLADVIRKGGNLGAHFDMEKEPDAAVSLQMLKLLENLIDYLHVLPHEITELEEVLDHNA